MKKDRFLNENLTCHPLFGLKTESENVRSHPLFGLKTLRTNENMSESENDRSHPLFGLKEKYLSVLPNWLASWQNEILRHHLMEIRVQIKTQMVSWQKGRFAL